MSTPAVEQNLEERGLLIQTWIENRMERDRTLLALSSAGLGLLATLLASDRNKPFLQVVVFGVASLAFLLSVLAGLAVFHLNAKYIEKLLQERSRRQPGLKIFTGVLVGGFIAGIVLTLFLAFWLAVTVGKGDSSVSSKETKIISQSDCRKSLDGLGNLLSGGNLAGPTGGDANPAGGQTGGGSGSEGSSGSPAKSGS